MLCTRCSPWADRPAVTLSQIAVLIYWLILGVAYRGLHGAVRGTGHVRTKRVTVETCGDLRAIRPLTEGQPSTEFALQADPVPSNVNGYPSVACMSITFELPLQCGVEAMDAW